MHEWLLDRQRDNIKETFRGRTSHSQFLPSLTKKKREELENLCPNFSSRKAFPSWSSRAKHTCQQLQCTRKALFSKNRTFNFRLQLMQICCFRF